MIGHYLLFNRNCPEALATYAEAFGGEIMEMQTYGDMPPNPNFPIADADKRLVLHAKLRIGDMTLMCADSAHSVSSGDNMYVSITTKDATLVQKAWDALKVDGVVYMELAPSFFAQLHGSLCDRFGINWMFTAER